MINRAAVMLRYREPAVRWIHKADPRHGHPGMTLSPVNPDRMVYRIREDDRDGPATVNTG